MCQCGSISSVIFTNLFHSHSSGLKNDPQREVFNLRHELHGKKFPCKYIRIGRSIYCNGGEDDTSDTV